MEMVDTFLPCTFCGASVRSKEYHKYSDPPTCPACVATKAKYPRLGTCFEHHWKLLLNKEVLKHHFQSLHPSPGKDIFNLAHAYVTGQGPLKGVVYPHAFIVAIMASNHYVLDDTDERGILLPKDLYFKIGNIPSYGDVNLYDKSRAHAAISARRTFGPWFLPPLPQSVTKRNQELLAQALWSREETE